MMLLGVSAAAKRSTSLSEVADDKRQTTRFMGRIFTLPDMEWGGFALLFPPPLR